MNQPLFLRVYENEKLISVKQFNQDQVVIGRQAEVDLDLNSEDISPIHAMIELRDGHYFICDLGSELGTLLNDRKVLDSEIISGDVVKLGKFSFEFYVGIPKPKSKPTKAPEQNAKISEIKRPEPVHVEKSDKPVEVSQVAKDSSPKVEEKKAVIPERPDTQPAAGGMEIIRPVVSRRKKSKKQGFAPKSQYKNLDEVIRPSKGGMVSVMLTWGDRVLTTYHTRQQGTVTYGSHPKNDIVIPNISHGISSLPLLIIKNLAEVFVPKGGRGQLYFNNTVISFEEAKKRGRTSSTQQGMLIKLEQGEMIRLDLGEGVCVYIRYVGQTPKVVPGSAVGLNLTELTAIFMALTIVLMMYFLVPRFTYDEDQPEEIAVTKFIFKRKAKSVVKPPVELKPQPIPTPPPPKKKPPVKVKAEDKTKKTQRVARQRKTPGRASDLRKNNIKKEKPKQLVSEKKGNGTKVNRKAGAGRKGKGKGATVRKRNVKDIGLLSVLSKGGVQDRLAKTRAGVGEIAGAAKKATGAAGAGGSSSVNAGGLREVGKGGQGTSTVGIAGAGTKGKGSGLSGYGEGNLGARDRGKIQLGGAGEEFLGSIDKEQVRRVVRSNLRQIQDCYEKELNRDPSLFGKLMVQWDIGAGGAVLKAKVLRNKSDIKNASLEKCVLRRLKTWRFPEPPEDLIATVTYPFAFVAK